MTPLAYTARDMSTKSGMTSHPICKGWLNGMLTTLTSSFDQNHHPIKHESKTTISSRTRSGIPSATGRITSKSSMSPASAPTIRAANGIHVWLRLRKSSFNVSAPGTNRVTIAIPIIVITTESQTTIPPMRGARPSFSMCSLLNSCADLPSRAVLPGVFFHALYLYR